MICTLPQYPAYLSAHGASLATADRDRYEKQRTIVCEIVAAFEEPGADVDPAAKLAPEEEQKRVQRTERVVDLVAKVSRGNFGFPGPPPAVDFGRRSRTGIAVVGGFTGADVVTAYAHR